MIAKRQKTSLLEAVENNNIRIKYRSGVVHKLISAEASEDQIIRAMDLLESAIIHGFWLTYLGRSGRHN